MAPRRTFFIMLVTITGVLYFLYTVYTSTLDGPTYRFSSWNKVFRNLSYSSSPYSQKKEEQYSRLNSLIGSISNMTSSSGGNYSASSEAPAANGSLVKRANKVAADGVGGGGVQVKVDEPKGANASAVAPPRNATKSPKSADEEEEDEEAKKKKKQKTTVAEEQGMQKSKDSFIQKIPPKMENVTVDYIVQGVITRTLYDSGFTIPNVELCPDFGQHLQVVILITSAPKHSEARVAIRQTWGHFQLRNDVAIAFLIGRSPDVNESVIRQESELYSDIILANFVDSYNNLTLKTVSILEWVDNFCGEAKFVLKTDDDMFINIPKLLQFIGNHLKDKRKIFGKLAKKWKPIRKKTSKYYVSLKQYRYSVFPDFTTGPAYLMTSDVIHDLYETALEKTYLKLEDVYTTGIVAQEERIQRVHVNEFFNRRITLSPCNVQKGISIHMIKPFEQYDMWKKLLDGRSKC